MMDSYTFDLQRIFLGDVPLLFVVEIALRTAIMFVYTLIALRFLGQRGIGQLSLFEFALIIALGSSVGDPMFYPDVPLIHGIAVVTVVIVLQRLLVTITTHSQRIENLVEGVPFRLVVEGRFDLKDLQRSGIARDELYMELRLNGAEHLGQVRYAFFEPNGKVSVFLFAPEDTRPGLTLLPTWLDVQPLTVPAPAPVAGHYACTYCGEVLQLAESDPLPPCPRCQHHEWLAAQMVQRTPVGR